MYDILDRVSCRCCSNKNNKELKNYKIYLPEYFEKLMSLTYKIWLGATNIILEKNTEKFWKKLEGARFDISKFKYEVFYDEERHPIMAISKHNYQKEQAIEIAKRELETDSISETESEMYVRYGLGTVDGEKKQRYWLEEQKTKISSPVWTFERKEK